MKLLIRNERCPGDVLMVTAAVRDLHRAFPGRYRTAVETSCMELWENNPLITPLDALGAPDRTIELDCAGVNQANQRPLHFLHACVEDLEQQLGVRIPVGPFRGDVHLSPQEMQLPPPLPEGYEAGRYWIVMAGGKIDCTTKWWDPQSHQSVVDHFRGKIQFVQCGREGDWHPPLRNVINLTGKTTIREFIRLMYHADGVLCPITFAMHLAAAVPPRPGRSERKPCVVIAGGREPSHWVMYPAHQFLHTVGALPCCASGGCWKSQCSPRNDGGREIATEQLCLRPVTVGDRLRIGECMTMITPAKVVQAMETYYQGGVLQYRDEIPSTSMKIRSDQQRRSGVAVTIGVGRYAEPARLAADELRVRTGLDVIVLGDREFEESGLEHPHYLKFRLFDLVKSDNILFFDADIVCLAAWDPASHFGSAELIAVRDRLHEFIVQESHDWSVPPEDYFNSGMMILNREHHHRLLRHAESLLNLRPAIFYDQSPLNAARVQLNIPLKLLDRRFNWMGFGDSSLSHEMPVVMAHELAPDRLDLNVLYLKGKYELESANIVLDENETRALSGRTFTIVPADGKRSAIRLRDDGVLSPPPADVNDAAYWFVQNSMGKPFLVLASTTRALHRFTQTADGLWESVSIDDATRCVDESIYDSVVMTRDNARVLADRFMTSVPGWPADEFHGRGVVLCAGDRYFPCAWVCIRMLRSLGCDLPIELWRLRASELSDRWIRLLERHGVRCVDASEVRRRRPVRLLDGWELKPYSILHSSFEEVLYLDADNVPTRDPTFLFDAEPYRHHGAIFWPDIGRLGPERAIWKICGVPYRDEPEIESGQIVVHKRRCWDALHLTMHLNEHSDFYYNFFHGDKETFHMAWRMLRQEYAMPARPIHRLVGTACQHDFDGERLFQHRNMSKWVVEEDGKAPNARIDGFEHEDLCLKFLRELSNQADARTPEDLSIPSWGYRPLERL